MKVKSILAVAAMLAGALLARSENTITTVIDGVTETRQVEKVTFDDTDPANVVLHFTDHSTLVADMSLVSIALSYNESAISDIIAASRADSAVYDLAGRRVADSFDGTQLPAGVYITAGKKILVK